MSLITSLNFDDVKQYFYKKTKTFDDDEIYIKKLEHTRQEYINNQKYEFLNGAVSQMVPQDDNIAKNRPDIVLNFCYGTIRLLLDVNSKDDTFVKLIKSAYIILNKSFAYDKTKVKYENNFSEHDQKKKQLGYYLMKTLSYINSTIKNKEESKCCRIMLIIIGRATFELNEFQAPARMQINKAIQESMGLTNLWAEFIENLGELHKCSELFTVSD